MPVRRPISHLTRWLGSGLMVWLAWLLLFTSPVQAQALQPIPELSARVIDQTGVLDASARQQISDALTRMETQRGSQMVVLLVPTTQPEDIAAYAWRVADHWKLGRRDVGDGLLLVVAMQDRKMRIEVARALEGAVPDLMAKRVIDEVLQPAFAQGQFGRGLLASVQAIDQLIAGEGLPPPQPRTSNPSSEFGQDWLFVLVAAVLFGRALAAMLGQLWGGLGGMGLMMFIGWSVSQSWLVAILAGVVGLLSAWVAGLSQRQLLGGAASGYSGGDFHGSSHGGFGTRSGRSSGGGFGSGGGGSFGGGGASGGW